MYTIDLSSRVKAVKPAFKLLGACPRQTTGHGFIFFSSKTLAWLIHGLLIKYWVEIFPSLSPKLPPFMEFNSLILIGLFLRSILQVNYPQASMGKPTIRICWISLYVILNYTL